MVHGLWPVAVAALVSFAATNTDDLISLVVFYAQTDLTRHSATSKPYMSIALGQILGFTVLNAICLIGLAFNQFIPTDYLGLIGFLPLLNGFWKLFKLVRLARQQGTCLPIAAVEQESESSEPILQRQAEDLEQVDEFAEIIIEKEVPKKEVIAVGCCEKLKEWLLVCFHFSAIEVALVVIGDGGDSISSTLPLFATETVSEVILTLVIYYALTLIMCVVALLVLRFRYIAQFMQKYGLWIRPLLLIGLGLYILSDSILMIVIKRAINGGGGGGDDDDDDDDDH